MSLKFLVKDVVSDEETTFRVQIELDGNTTKVAVYSILKECQMVWPHIKSTSCLVVHCGIVKSPNENLIVDIPKDSSKASVIYLYQTSDEVCKLCKFTVDDASIQAAQKWISSSTDPIHHVTCQLATTLLGNEATTRHEPPIAPQGALLREDPRDGRAVLRWVMNILQPGLLLRLAFIFGLLQYNRSSSDLRTCYIAGGLLVIYLFQSGALSYILRTLRNQLADRVVPVDEADHRGVIGYFQRLARDGVKIPIKEGLLHDALSLLISAVGSFFPGWVPQAENIG